MSISYIDLVETMQQTRSDGRTVDHVVITEDTRETLVENMVTVDGTEIPEPDDEDSIGIINGFDVKVGGEHKLVTADGKEFAIK